MEAIVQDGLPKGAYEFQFTLTNRTRRWRFNINRFGLPLFLAGHATRLPGLRAFRPGIRRRMDEMRGGGGRRPGARGRGAPGTP